MTVSLVTKNIDADGTILDTDSLATADETTARSCWDRANEVGFGVYTDSSSNRYVYKYVKSTGTVSTLDVTATFNILSCITISYDGTKLLVGGDNTGNAGILVEYSTDLVATGNTLLATAGYLPRKIIYINNTDFYYLIESAVNSSQLVRAEWNGSIFQNLYRDTTDVVSNDFSAAPNGILWASMGTNIDYYTDDGSRLVDTTFSNDDSDYIAYDYTNDLIVSEHDNVLKSYDVADTPTATAKDTKDLTSFIDGATNISTLDVIDGYVYFCATVSGVRKTYRFTIASDGTFGTTEEFSSANCFTYFNDAYGEIRSKYTLRV